MLNKELFLHDALLTEIKSGNYKSAASIPSRNQLARKYSCSRNTVERAIARLMKSGILYAEKGRGTFVRPQKTKGHIKRLFLILAAAGDSDLYDVKSRFWGTDTPKIPMEIRTQQQICMNPDEVSAIDSAVIWNFPGYNMIHMIDHFALHGIPQLLINREFNNYNYVKTDIERSLREGLTFLMIEAGRNIAIITQRPTAIRPYMEERVRTFYEVCIESGIQIPSGNIFSRDFKDLPSEISEIASLIFTSPHPPRGIFLTMHNLVMPFLVSAKAHGKTVGKDFALLVFDEIPELSRTPKVAMLKQSLEQFSKEALRWLEGGYAENGKPFHIKIKAELITDQFS